MPVPTLQNNGWISPYPWAEFVTKDGSKGATFTNGWNDDNHAVFNILVNWGDYLDVEKAILGVAEFDPVTESLSRTPPVQHPGKHDLRAEKIITAVPMRWTGKMMETFEYGWGAGGNQSALSEYKFMMLSIGFSVPKYVILTDTDNAGQSEFNRWTT